MEVVKNVLALISIGIMAGLLYWIGFFHGYREGVDTIQDSCKKNSVLTFNRDNSKYLCVEVPTKFKPKKEKTYDNI